MSQRPPLPGPIPCPSPSISGARIARGSHVREPNDVTPRRAEAIDVRLQDQLSKVGLVAAPTLAPGSVRIDVRVHVITRDNGTGNVPRRVIDDQIAVLNSAYRGSTEPERSFDTPFRFTVTSVSRTANSDWYHWSRRDDDQEAKSALHRGGSDDLNLYITGLSNGLLGYATFPTGRDKETDGVVVLNASLPGGAAAPYNKGDTATHEVGHWLNLFHTFENGCNWLGDSVADTPAQKAGSNVFSCVPSKDTCPSKTGKDPVHNFMNYSEDACVDRFTKGQARRMSDAWLALRAP